MPHRWNAPTVNLSRAVARRRLVLSAMHEQGSSTRTRSSALQQNVALRECFGGNSHSVSTFRKKCPAAGEAIWLGTIIGGGLRVYHAIDPSNAARGGGEYREVARTDERVGVPDARTQNPESGTRNPDVLEAGARRVGIRQLVKYAPWLEAETSVEPIQSRDAGAAPAGFCVQNRSFMQPRLESGYTPAH